ncbi:DUF4129 domain-containing protein [Pseudomonas akapageensis]|uniref:DUF4129 domain-containing protein n=1 Tax=Pseudomonas akapageensis TaxID=2609961 RepID=UPI00140A713A|nr:DUF4129 domain-containing protein [Pseudomonas akapageensis]
MHPDIVIDPRTPWEAMDLGVLMAQRHRRLLMVSWAAISLPVFILLSLLFRDSPSIALLLFWWLKPAFERLSLDILSQALFAEPPSLGQALRRWPSTLKPQLLASLTWRRFSLSRSFSLPVTQLEKLSGQARLRRLAILRKRNLGAARWLTTLGANLEAVFWLGSMALLYLLLPQQFVADWNWQQLLEMAESNWLWLEHLTNLFYALILVFWGPIYVACGFSLYLNRRTTLEAWDIELVLRSLRQRLSALAVVLVCVFLSLSPAPETRAAPAIDSPQMPHLQQQALDSQTAHQAINAILDKPPFRNSETVTRWRLGHEPSPGERSGALGTWFDSLDGHIVVLIARTLEVLLWVTLIGLLALLAWHYRRWFETFVSRRSESRTIVGPAPEQLFGLPVSVQSLPDDIAGSAERLWQDHPREALGLLYRALLSRLLNDYRLPIRQADTENQVLAQVVGLGQPALSDFSARLTHHWQTLAYGHRLPPAQAQQDLCNGWRQLFDKGARQ